MSKKQTEKSNYPSRYSPNGFVSPSQYILELVCEKQAKSQGKELPIHFWNQPEWKNTFIKQLRKVHLLLRKYSDKAIIHAINNNNIRSLLVPWIEDTIKKEVKLLNAHPEPQVANTVQRTNQPITFIKDNAHLAKMSILGKLEEIENG